MARRECGAFASVTVLARIAEAVKQSGDATNLSGKVIVVTGGGSGIGAAIAERLAAHGARVIRSDIRPESITGVDNGTEFFEQDVGDPASWESLERYVTGKFGKLDGLVNNAGIYRPDTIVETSIATFREIMRVNVEGTLLGCQSALRLMTAGGSIVNIASAAAMRPGPTDVSYGMSKAAIVNLTKAVASHCITGKLNIRCNAICPGGVETPMSARTLTGPGARELAQRLRDASVTGALGKPSEIAAVAAFLLSSEAAFMTGVPVLVDGGFSL